MLRMHGGGLFICHGACPLAYLGIAQSDIPSFKPISRDVEIRANHVRVVHVSSASICRNAPIPNLRLDAWVVASVLGLYDGWQAESDVEIETVTTFLRCS